MTMTYDEAITKQGQIQRLLAAYDNGTYHTAFDREDAVKQLRAAERVIKRGQVSDNAAERVVVAPPASFSVACQWTGLVFQAPSKRQKTHPGMSVTNDWPSVYRQRFAATVSKVGMFDHPSVEAVRAEIVAEMNVQADAASQRQNDRRDAAKQRHYDKNARDEQNAILRNYDYSWTKQDQESMDFAGPNAFAATYGERGHVWLLIAPDGREVSVRQAMEEIAAKGGPQAQRWLAQNPAK